MMNPNQQVTAEKIYKCGHCGATNDSLMSLKQHMVDVHMPNMQMHQTQQHQQPQSVQSQSMVEAPNISTDDSQTQSSFDAKRKTTKFKCGHCGILVASVDELRSHMLSDHVEDSELAKELAQSQNVPEKGVKYYSKVFT